MHQASEHAPPPPATAYQPDHHGPAGGSTHTLFSTNRGYPFPRRRAQEDCVHHPGEHSQPHPQPFSPSARTQHPGSTTNARNGAGQRCPAPLPLPRTQGSIAHANKPTPGREHASKQASRGKGAAGPHCPTTPSKRANTKKAQTPQANTTQTQTPNPNHPQANTPTTGAAPHAQTLSRPRHSAWASKEV